MFTDNTTIGVITALAFIVGIMFFVVHYTKPLIAEQRILFLLIFLITLLSSTWVIDKIIAFKIQLLHEEESKRIFDMIETVVTLTLGYYLGTKKNE